MLAKVVEQFDAARVDIGVHEFAHAHRQQVDKFVMEVRHLKLAELGERRLTVAAANILENKRVHVRGERARWPHAAHRAPDRVQMIGGLRLR